MESGMSYITDTNHLTIFFPNLRFLEKYQKMHFLFQLMVLGRTQASPYDEDLTIEILNVSEYK